MLNFFPRANFENYMPISSQLKHVLSEAKEVEGAFENKEGMARVVEELLDLIWSAQTAVNIIAKQGYGIEVEDLVSEVIDKNVKRGYL